jgi:acid stress-induced BolA-like protein IbaG/YrbA
MLATDEIEKIIEEGIPGATATVTGDGYKYEARVISDQFKGLSTMKQHQMVYATVNEHITSGALHALSIKTEVPE